MKAFYHIVPSVVLAVYVSVCGYLPATGAFHIVDVTKSSSGRRHTLPMPQTRAVPSHPLTVRPRHGGASDTALRGILEGIFGGLGKTMNKEKEAVLATYTIDAVSDADAKVKLDGLTDFLTDKWIQLFQNGSILLTTPVGFVTDKVWEPEDGVETVKGIQLIFAKNESGYKKDSGDETADEGEDKEEEPREGGVEILVEKLANSNKLRVRARRCEVDDGTIIKEMSEETIVSELGQAVDAWKKESK